jgi:hypothetical protein
VARRRQELRQLSTSALLGFWLARRWPPWATAALVVVLEVGLGLAIRDNLTLNILMLIHPVDAVRRWQIGA